MFVGTSFVDGLSVQRRDRRRWQEHRERQDERRDLCADTRFGKDERATGRPIEAALRRRIEDERGRREREIARDEVTVEKATGLTFKTPPVLEVRTREQVREFLVARFNEQSPASELARSGAPPSGAPALAGGIDRPGPRSLKRTVPQLRRLGL